MALPRIGIAALAARLSLNKSKLLTIVEGFTDKRCLSRLVSTNIEMLAIAEVEAPLFDRFHGYGDNKARLLSTFCVDEFRSFANENFVGLVDRDLDGVLRPELDVNGVYYTEFSCLISFVLDSDSIRELFDSVFAVRLNDLFLSEVQTFAERMYLLRGYLQAIDDPIKPPELGKSVRTLSEGGFDWDRYTNAVAQQSGLKKSDLISFLEQEAPKIRTRAGRLNVHFHTLAIYIAALLRKERVVNPAIGPEEVERHLVGFYLRVGASCPSVALLEAHADRLRVQVIEA
jgi:hypothetical protein